MFRTGYIHSLRSDLIWFLLLPFWAMAFAFFAQSYMSAMVLISISLWITFPHHAATWVRTFGLKEDIALYKQKLIIGPIVIIGMAILGLKFAPLAFSLVILCWGYQHSIMQQHGFARIYDFKAGTGTGTTGKWDLALNWIAFTNLLITGPLFVQFWVRSLYDYNLPVSPATVGMIQTISWSVLAIFMCFYANHVIQSLRNGYSLNPLKYWFIASSYLLWYVMAWSTDNVLVFGVADRIMHGVQYIVIVYYYLDNKSRNPETGETAVKKLIKYGNVFGYLSIILAYSAFYQLILKGNSPDEFLFGFVAFMQPHLEALPEHGLEPMSESGVFAFSAIILVETLASIHYYYDSFIWKVSSKKTQKGL